jgi:hypothetical protein
MVPEDRPECPPKRPRNHGEEAQGRVRGAYSTSQVGHAGGRVPVRTRHRSSRVTALGAPSVVGRRPRGAGGRATGHRSTCTSRTRRTARTSRCPPPGGRSTARRWTTRSASTRRCPRRSAALLARHDRFVTPADQQPRTTHRLHAHFRRQIPHVQRELVEQQRQRERIVLARQARVAGTDRAGAQLRGGLLDHLPVGPVDLDPPQSCSVLRAPATCRRDGRSLT